MLIENVGPKIEARDIAALEAELGADLPDSYREFLLLYNGGAPTPDTVDVSGAPGTPTDVQVFFGIARPVESSDVSWNLSLLSERCVGFRALPIACDSGGNLFCLKIERGVATEVIYCDLDDPDCVSYAVAPSFEEFIAKLRPFEHMHDKALAELEYLWDGSSPGWVLLKAPDPAGGYCVFHKLLIESDEIKEAVCRKMRESGCEILEEMPPGNTDVSASPA
jgi:cell wall assembly regulator SMI1